MSKVPAIRFKGFDDPWEQRKLGDISNSYSGGTPLANNPDYYSGAIPFIRSAEINSDKTELFLSEKGLTESSAAMVDVGCILYALYGATSGEVGISRINGAINQAILAIYPNDGFDAEFIASWLRRQKGSIVATYLQGGQGNLSGTIVKNLELPIPSLKEQRQIGALLSSLGSLITLHQRKCDKLVVLKKALLDKMFPRDGSNTPEIRFAGFTDPWEQRKLDELATFGGGHTPSMADDSNYADGEILWVTSQDVKVDYLEDTTTKLTEKGASELKLYPKGTLIMVTRSGILRHTLPVSMLRKPSTVNQDIRTISTSEECSSLWLMQYLKARSRDLLLEYGKTGTTVESIDFAKLKTMRLMLPEPSEQKAIGGLFYRLDELITLHQRKLEALRNLKSALLQKMFV